MKSLTLKSLAEIALLAVIIFWCGCTGMQIQLIEQPAVAEPGDTISIPIIVGIPGRSANYYPPDSSLRGSIYNQVHSLKILYLAREDSLYPVFSICVPDSAVVLDSIFYRVDRDTAILTGTLLHVHQLDGLIYNQYTGYRWWSFMGTCPVRTDDKDIRLEPRVVLPQGQEDYLFHYDIGEAWMAGFDTNNTVVYFSSLVSENHFLTTGMPEQYVVTSTETMGPGTLQMAIDSVESYGIITFDIDLPATISLGNLNITKPMWIKGPEEGGLSLTFLENARCVIDIYYSDTHGKVKFSDLEISYCNSDMIFENYNNSVSGLCFENVVFNQNVAGVAIIYNSYGQHMDFMDCVFKNNNEEAVAPYIIFGENCAMRFMNCEFVSNYTDGNAKMMWLNIVDAEFYNTVFRNVAAPIEAHYGDILFQNVTIAEGSPMDWYDTDLKVRNSVLWNGQVYQLWLWNYYNFCLLDASYNNIGGQFGIPCDSVINWESNISEDPMFIGYGHSWCCLQDGSPCIDAGTPDTTGLGLPPCDISGNYRVWDGDGDGVARIDIGAYEHNAILLGTPDPVTINGGGIRMTAYPNPVSWMLNVVTTLPSPSKVRVEICSLNGTILNIVSDSKLSAGDHHMTIDMTPFPPGIYLLRMNAGEELLVSKIVKP